MFPDPGLRNDPVLGSEVPRAPALMLKKRLSFRSVIVEAGRELDGGDLARYWAKCYPGALCSDLCV